MHRISFVFIVVCAVITCSFIGCSGGEIRTSDDDLQHLGYAELLELQGKGSDKSPVLLIDIREQDAFAKGHIPGAINIPDAQLASSNEPLLKTADAIVVYSQTYNIYTDAAAKTLLHRGFDNVYCFSGGWKLWQKQASDSEPVDSK